MEAIHEGNRDQNDIIRQSKPKRLWYINPGSHAELWIQFYEGSFASVFHYDFAKNIDLRSYSQNELTELLKNLFKEHIR